jgi:predicted O-linked N-acetylglucosamine transferase (SPINDLY family)
MSKKSFFSHSSPTLAHVIERAETFSKKGKLEEAVVIYRQWLGKQQLAEHASFAWYNLAVLLRQMADIPGCIKAYRKAIELGPNLYQASVNLGLALEVTGQSAEALQVWQKALQATEAQNLLLNHMGRLLEEKRQYPQAELALFKSLVANPDQSDVIQHYIGLRRKQCKWPSVPDWLIELSNDPTPQLDCGTLMGLAELADPAEQALAVQRYVDRKMISTQIRLSPTSSYGHARLRVGYFSGDFKMHAVSILTAELFELHDRSRFEVVGLDYAEDDGSPMRQRVLNSFDLHVPLQGLSDKEAAHAIRAAEVDILLDLTGLTGVSRSNILRYKPAPVQLIYLGYMATTCLPEIDYVLVDKFLFPDSLRPHFVEKPLYLPRCYQVNDRQREMGPKPSRMDCDLPEDKFVFCCFNNSFKLSPDVLKAWARILIRAHNSVLWLLEDNEFASERITKFMQSQGVEPQRIIFAPRVQPHEHLARNQCADLFLDSPPCGAGVTASEAIRAGLPLLTLPGPTLVSRVAGSLLHGANLPDLIMEDWLSYENMAVKLATESGAIDALKARIKTDCEIFDTPSFVRDLENLLLEVALK